ncbi:hypothetical protein ONS95_006942 [Cadophora gregata]|uniref:uncharacterized protein n=1 Tax=Cadophora gregata TaxID=51156 RepID=UPI0026DA7C86|nr:uncharacterized protein ONS95_006942 [Cadophora gregata]KAK0101792.1 hypothetical protein ONS95_006942 [Cadophora gregata]
MQHRLARQTRRANLLVPVDDRRQNGHEEWGLPKYDGSYGGLQIAWRRRPTPEQAKLIEAGTFSTSSVNEEQQLPGMSYNEELDAEVVQYVCRRGTYSVQVINRAMVKIAGIQGISLMSSWKQILPEYRAVFYGENTFVFDTRGQDPYTHHRGVHASDAFKRYSHQCPGLPLADGTVSHRNTERSITHMFDKDARHQSFISRDPLKKFFRETSQENASAISKVIIKGYFRPVEENERSKYKRPLGFGRILPMHATILKKSVPTFESSLCTKVTTFPSGTTTPTAPWDLQMKTALTKLSEKSLICFRACKICSWDTIILYPMVNQLLRSGDHRSAGRKLFGLVIVSGRIDQVRRREEQKRAVDMKEGR